MRGDRRILLLLLASSLTFLASLYLQWIAGSTVYADAGTYTNAPTGGWFEFGEPAGLLALGLAVGAAASLARPSLASRLPLATSGFALLFFAVLSATLDRDIALGIQAEFGHAPVHFGYGAYIGLASATICCLVASGLRWTGLPRLSSTTAAAGCALSLGVLANFLVPNLTFRVPHLQPPGGASGYQLYFGGTLLTTFISGLACFGLPLWLRATRPDARFALAVGLAVLTAGALTPLGTHSHWPWQAWLLLACSVGLVALAVVAGRRVPLSLSVVELAAVAAALLLVVSLFLPWEKACPHGACPSVSGWDTFVPSPIGGALAVLFLVALLGFRRFSVEFAVGAAAYVMVTGSELTQGGIHLGYGAPLGFAGAALLLAAAARKFHPFGLIRLVPMVACAAFIAIPMLALNEVRAQFELDSPWRLSLLTAAAILVAVGLLRSWMDGRGDELVLLPLGLLALTTLDLIDIRQLGISWEGWLSVALCLFLLALGWIERTRGLKGFRVPEEIWRIDRLPEAES